MSLTHARCLIFIPANPSMNSENQPPNPLHSSLPASKQTPHCETIKTLLELLTSCRDGENCSVAQCSALKNIILLGIGSKGVDGLNREYLKSTESNPIFLNQINLFCTFNWVAGHYTTTRIK